MGQVPAEYLIIGDGRLAKHLNHYLSLLSIQHRQWSRKTKARLAVRSETIVIIAISDRAIEPFIKKHQILTEAKYLIHCSGSLKTPLAHCVHPLMSFSNDLYTKDRYLKMNLIIDKNTPNGDDLLPGLPNRCFQICPQMRQKYHAICVMANNFTSILWNKLFEVFSKDLGFPEDVSQTYMEQSFLSLAQNPHTALTGPLVRNDQKTIASNLDALKDDPFEHVYRGFLEAYQGERSKQHS